MADVSSSATTAGLWALLNHGLPRGETAGVPAATGRDNVDAALDGVSLPRLDSAQDLALPADADWRLWDGEPGSGYGYLPNASTLSLRHAPSFDALQLLAAEDGEKAAHAINGDQRATTLRTHLAVQEDRTDDDDGIYSPVLRVTRRDSANM